MVSKFMRQRESIPSDVMRGLCKELYNRWLEDDPAKNRFVCEPGWKISTHYGKTCSVRLECADGLQWDRPSNIANCFQHLATLVFKLSLIVIRNTSRLLLAW